jgi:NAD(P)-dependent dehydrogenase (short-subunit alcohol dehydrogenase family)
MNFKGTGQKSKPELSYFEELWSFRQEVWSFRTSPGRLDFLNCVHPASKEIGACGLPGRLANRPADAAGRAETTRPSQPATSPARTTHRRRPPSAGRDDTDASRLDPNASHHRRPRARAQPLALTPEEKMMIRQTWFVSGAASHLGADIVRRALAAGHRVVATDVDPLAVLHRVGNVADARLLALALDEVDARAVGIAVKAALARFGGIDVLVHGAAACSPQGEFDMPAPRRDFSASVRALFNVTRGVLEAMREQCAGRILHLVPAPDKAHGPTLFSIAGFCEAVAADVAPFRIEVSAVPAHRIDTLLRAPSGDEMMEEA